MATEGEKILSKPALTDETLKACGISYDPELYLVQQRNDDPLPPQVETVRRKLLYFKETIHPHWKESKKFWPDGSPSPADSAWLQNIGVDASTKEEKRKEEDVREAMLHCIQSATTFQRLANNLERGWTQALLEKIFRPFTSVTITAHARYQEWTLAEDLHWNEFSRYKRKNVNEDLQRQGLTGPKPDMTYGFPVYGPEQKIPDGGRYFAYEFLRDLYFHPKLKVRTAPSAGIRTSKTFRGLMEEHLLCYPWAVVEVKHAKVDDKDIKFCYRQAANAAAAALDIRYSLFASSHPTLDEDKVRGLPIPPIITFTCVGPSVKVWLAYLESSTNRKRMRCIFQTNLEWAWGVSRVCTIVSEMQDWALNVLHRDLLKCSEFIELQNIGASKTPSSRSPQPDETGQPDEGEQGTGSPDTEPVLPGSWPNENEDGLVDAPADVAAEIPVEAPVEAPAVVDLDNEAGPNQKPGALVRHGTEATDVGEHDGDGWSAEGPPFEHGSLTRHGTGFTDVGEFDEYDGDAQENADADIHAELPHRPGGVEREHDGVPRSQTPLSLDLTGLAINHDGHESRETCKFNDDAFQFESGSETEKEDDEDDEEQDEEDEEEQEEQRSSEEEMEDEEIDAGEIDDQCDSEDLKSVDDHQSDCGSVSSENSARSSNDVENASVDSSGEHVASSPRKQNIHSKAEIVEVKNAATIEQRNLESLEGSIFTSLPTFISALNKLDDTGLISAIETCLFIEKPGEFKLRLRDEWTTTGWPDDHVDKLNSITTDLNSLNTDYCGAPVTMKPSRHQPDNISQALNRLSDAGQTRKLHRIFVNLMKCYKGVDIINVLETECIVTKERHWNRMKEEALGTIAQMKPALYRR